MLDEARIAESDPKLHDFIRMELERQRDNLELIASENLVSRGIMELTGSVLTNKYAEGYPGKRYYGGCEYVDMVEDLARERAMGLFSAEFVNVQPHSGSQANMAAYRSILRPGDTVMGMDLAHGGHLTHGSRVNFSGQDYRIVSYGVERESEVIDYSVVRDMALREKPRLIVVGASAYSRFLDFERFRAIADECGALMMTDMAHIAGLVAAGEHPSPVPHSHITTTTTHKSLRGPRGGMILSGRNITNDMGIKAPKSGRVKLLGELINSNIFPGIQGGPLMHVIAAKALCFHEASKPSFANYQKRVRANARILSDCLQSAGLRIVSGGTDNHLFLVDLSSIDISGLEAETWLDRAGITVNKNAIPYDPKPPRICSGVRLGTPAVTSRGCGEKDMVRVADCIIEVFESRGEENRLASVRQKVKNICTQFPIYGYMDS